MFERKQLNHEGKVEVRQRVGKAFPFVEASRCTGMVKKSKAQSARGSELPGRERKTESLQDFFTQVRLGPDLCFTKFARMAVGRIEGGDARGRHMN